MTCQFPVTGHCSKENPQSSQTADSTRTSGSIFTTADGTIIFYKDWGHGQPIVFSHGAPLTSDDWDAQLLFFTQNGYRVIAHDRRSHGRSTQTFHGNDMNTYADDLAALLDHLNVKDAILVGHSTGGGEITRYMGRHGTRRITKAVLIGAVTPHYAQAPNNPDGAPMIMFDGQRASLMADRSQALKDTSIPFYGFNRPGAKVSEGFRDHFWLMGMQGGILGQYECIKALSETDFTEDLKSIDVPVLVMHGDDDQIVPLAISGAKSAKLLRQGRLKVYSGYPHGMHTTHADVINADLLDFIRS